MTANAMAAERQECLDAGMNEHVAKPFELNHMVKVLRHQAGWQDKLKPT
jgi:CheY-like chemotaxis protein